MTLSERLMLASTIVAAVCLVGSVICVVYVVRLVEQHGVPAELALLNAERERNANRVNIGGYKWLTVSEWPKTLTLRRYRDRFGDKIANHSDREVAEAAWKAEGGHESPDLHKEEWIAFFMERNDKPLSAYATATGQ